jgi:hypothetical protein
MLGGLGLGVADQLGYVGESEAKLAVEQDLLQPPQVVIVVTAVSRARAPGRRQQSDLVIVMQGPDADAGQPGDLAHRVAHGLPLMRAILDHDVTCGSSSIRGAHAAIPGCGNALL